MGTRSLQDVAIHLVKLKEDGKFEVNEEAMEKLATLKSKIGVVGIAGKYRTGKSYVLNRLLGRQDGFDVGPTINPCTKGIWMWSDFMETENEAGDKLSLVLLDTEGLGATDQDTSHDAKVFSLAVLLSSYLIFNSQGTIDENALEQLSLVVNLSKHVHLRSQQPNSDDSGVVSDEYDQHFPSFMWLVRDFALQLIDESGRSLTPREYLERSLVIREGFDAKTVHRNQIRHCITKYFRDRDCDVIVRPVDKEEDLQDLSRKKYEDLRGEFQKQMNALRDKILRHVRPKTVFGQSINGIVFAGLVRSYVEAINSGAVPNIQSAWESVVEHECRSAMDEQAKFFADSLKAEVEPRMPIEDAELEREAEKLRAEAMQRYKDRAMGETMKQYKLKLKELMRASQEEVARQNAEKSTEFCKQLLDSHHAVIDNKVQEHKYGKFEQYSDDWKQVLRSYRSEARGPSRTAVLLDFVDTRQSEVVQRLTAHFEEQAEKALHAKEQELADLRVAVERERSEWKERTAEMTLGFEREKSELKATFTAEKAVLERDRTQLQTEKDYMGRELDSSRKRVEELTRTNETLSEERKKFNSKKRELQEELNMTKSQLQQLQQENSALRSAGGKKLEKKVEQRQSMNIEEPARMQQKGGNGGCAVRKIMRA